MDGIGISENPAHCTSGTCSASEEATGAGFVDNAAEAPVQSLYTEAVAELVAIAANCNSCFKYHFQQARKLGVSREDRMRVVKTADFPIR